MNSVCGLYDNLQEIEIRLLAPPFPKKPKRLTDYKELFIINNLLCPPPHSFLNQGQDYFARVFVAQRDISLGDVFYSPDLMCLTEHQVVVFCEELLQGEEYRHHLPTFFLVKNEENESIVILSVFYIGEKQGNRIPGYRVRMDTFRGNPKTVLRDVGVRMVVPV
jgi:hypothetical protein